MPTTVKSIRDIPEGAAKAVLQAGGTVLVFGPEEILETPPVEPVDFVPQVVTMRQARLALFGAGLLGEIDVAIAALPEPQKTAAQITWEYSAEIERGNDLMTALAGALGLSSAEIDALFIAAANL